MSMPSPYAYRDFERAKESLRTAICDLSESYALLSGDTGTGKSALLRQLRQELDRGRMRVVYFSESRRLGLA